MSNVPTLPEFFAAAREAFAFLGRFGFREVSPPAGRDTNPFQIWFGKSDRFVVVSGEGYGSAASVYLEYGGRELAEAYLVPTSELPARSKEQRPAQLEQIRSAAARLERHGGDFLAGDLGRFLELSKALPPYKMSPSDNRGAG